MTHSVVALVDCNNFYASCEKVFDPMLRTKPVVILSNNDGCIVARSAEAKKLSIPMGVPYFKIADQLRSQGVIVRSSNYALYGDMSQRVMQVLEQFSPEVERYSIDEAFISLDHVPPDTIDQYIQQIHAVVELWTGIPISIGVAQTKTLAKIANHVAKKDNSLLGCCNFFNWSTEKFTHFLASLPVEEVWGIGYRSAKKLRQCDICTAADFRMLSLARARQLMSVLGEKICLELRGISCLPLELLWKPRKGIMYTRGFGKDIVSLNEMEEAVATYTMRAWHKLAKQNSSATALSLFIKNNRFSERAAYFSRSQSLVFSPTHDPSTLIKHALSLLRVLFQPGIRYHKAGVFLNGIESTASAQPTLWDDAVSSTTPANGLADVIGSIHKRFGREKLYFAVQGQKQAWNMRQAYRSPRYTTNLSEIPKFY